MNKQIKPEHLRRLQSLESKLKRALRSGRLPLAEALMKEVQELLAPYGHHHRLLECKLWYFEGLFDANHVALAESGFHGIQQRAAKNTRLYVESSLFIALCLLRRKKANEAKVLLKTVVAELNKIKSPETRRLLQKRLLDRIEEEAVLAGMIGIEEGILKPEQIHEQAVKLIQKPEDEIMEIIGSFVPYEAGTLLQNVRNDVVLQLPNPDRKYLPAPGQASQPLHLGRRLFAAVRRISWRTLCDPDSPLFHLWAEKTPEVYTAAYFATSVTKAFSNWRIGLPMVAAGVVAIAMKYSAQEYCENGRPEGIMETRRKKQKPLQK